MQRSAAVTLLLVFLAAHLALLPRTLEDLDSVNFALGVRHFDVARHQPHPPGYPVFIALAKVSTAVFRAVAIDAPAVRGLSVWSALFGAAALPVLLLLFRSLERREHLAWWATCVAGAAPLYWSTALRPLSDTTGFSFAIASQALTVFAIRDRLGGARERSLAGHTQWSGGQAAGAALILAGFIAGLGLGVRVQTGILTAPLLMVVLIASGRDLSPSLRLWTVVAAVAGALAWALPLLIASGGIGPYLDALGAQAGEDFSGVVMLWTHRTPRVAAAALINSFIWPWGWWLGVTVSVLAILGAARVLWRGPRAAAVLLVAFGPYAVFHLLFHETETVRYALPLVPPVVYVAVAAVESQRVRILLPVMAAGLAAVSLAIALPPSAVYARDGAPIFRLFDDMATTAHGGGDRVDVIAMHATARRAAEWVGPVLPARVSTAFHGREAQALVALWKAEPAATVWFAADPRRSDLALFDARSRELVRSYRWGFTEPPIVGGARPDNVDWLRMQAPGWMLDRGWSVTAEVGGITARDGLGPHHSPSVAWLRGRDQDVTAVLGGRHLGTSDSPVTMLVKFRGAQVDSWQLKPGFFVRQILLPAGGSATVPGYLPLEVTAESASHVPVSLEQFDAQGPGTPMVAYDEGWHEPEYSPGIGRAWRWASERARLWVRPIGRAVTLRMTGQSPRRYFDAAPTVRILVAGREVSTFQPFSDFDQTASLPADLLATAQGRVVLETSKFFVPGGNGQGDQRHLSLRVFDVRVE